MPKFMTKDAKLRFVEAHTPKAFFDLIKETYDKIESEMKDREDSRETDPTKR